LTDCIFQKKKTIGIFPACCPHNSAQCQPLVTEVSEQDRAQFTHKWKGTVSCGILQTGPWNLAKFSAENCGPYLWLPATGWL